jgi:peroxidase
MNTIAKGMTFQSAQTYDNFVTQELTNFLNASSTNIYLLGSDLVVRNIQRARDNNLGGWANYRRFCVGDGPNTWNDKPIDISQRKWNDLMTLYSDVNDIDLFTGMLAENLDGNAVLGRTASCIVKQQFSKIQSGDRYFFSHFNGGSGFTNKQVRELKSVKMFDIICLNTDITRLQERAFENLQSGNRPISCSKARGIDINNFF